MRFILLALLAPLSLLAQQPTANFTASTQSVCQGSPVTFTSTSTSNGSPITSYVWDFGDGSSATTQNASHIYSVTGPITVTLTVTAANGIADAEVKVNYITVNPRPTANFSAATNGCTLPVGVNFTNSSTGTGLTYSWNFGGGSPNTSTSGTPATVTYSTAGTYNVNLIITSDQGCKDTATQAIVVSNFAAGINAPATACQNTPVSITDGSTVGANAWNWTFAGGSPGSSTSQNQVVTYSTPGTYTINLSAQNTTSGCSGSTSQQITILPLPTPSFTVSPTTGCAPLTATFNNTSGSGTFVWDFGDGSTFTGTNPGTHTYNTNGSFTVTLTMTGSNGCSATVTQPNAVTLTAPAASFTSNVTNGCEPLQVTFASTTTSSDPIVSYVWNFGNGNTYTGQTPPVQTYNVGLYDVSLTITTQGGCVSTDTIQDYIQVGKIDNVDFTLATSPECAKTPVHFTNLTSILAPHDPSEVTYYWDFEEGTSTQMNPDYSYTSDTGYFDVTLIVTFRGCKDTLTIPDAVYIKPPISRFQPDITLFCNQGPNGHVVTVNDQSIINSITPPQDALVTWSWGDNTPNTVMDDPVIDDADKSTTTHTYNGYGTYTIKQVIHNYTTGCSDSTTATIYVSMTDITSMTSLNDSVCKNSSMSFGSQVTVQAASHNPVTYTWTMGDGGSVSGQNPSYTYTTAGTYSILLTATNAVGCSDNQTLTPFRVLELPSAGITADDYAGCAPFIVTFSNSSAVQGNGVPLNHFNWTFDDPPAHTVTTSSVGQTVKDTFNTEGVFTATLVAVDNFGCQSAPATASITITKPVATFTVDSVVCNLEAYTGLNASTGTAPLTYRWYVDGIDGSAEGTSQDYSSWFTETNAGGIYAHPHTLTLVTTDVNGCMDTAVRNIVVSTPIAALDTNLSAAAVNSLGQFTCPPVFGAFVNNSESVGSITSYYWNFGDGKQSILENPSNTYVFPGTYTLTFAITDQYGCTDTTVWVDYLTILGPTATPSWSTGATTCGQDITFDIGATTNVTGIVWTLDDGTTVNDSTHFIHTYQDITTYNPTVSVSDMYGCIVPYPLDPITIPDNGLNALFSVSPGTEVDLGTLVTYVNQSSSVQPIVEYTWNFGSGPNLTTGSGANQQQVYYIPGYYTVILTVEDANGCFDSYQATIFVDGDFQMPNVITTNGDNINDEFLFPYPIFSSFDVLIVNRWGNVIHEAKNQTGQVFWNGKSDNGNEVTDGVYFYILKATLLDGTNLKKEGDIQVFGH